MERPGIVAGCHHAATSLRSGWAESRPLRQLRFHVSGRDALQKRLKALCSGEPGNLWKQTLLQVGDDPLLHLS